VIFSRYEAALIQGDLAGVPVVPVYICQPQSKREILQGEYKAFKISGAEYMFPDVPHHRSADATQFLTSLLNGRPFPMYLRSIRSTMERVLKMRGWRSRRGLDKEELNELTDLLISTLPE